MRLREVRSIARRSDEISGWKVNRRGESDHVGDFSAGAVVVLCDIAETARAAVKDGGRILPGVTFGHLVDDLDRELRRTGL